MQIAYLYWKSQGTCLSDYNQIRKELPIHNTLLFNQKSWTAAHQVYPKHHFLKKILGQNCPKYSAHVSKYTYLNTILVCSRMS